MTNPLEDPPNASSSEEDEIDSSAEEEDSSEEDEPKDPVKSAAVTIAVPGKTTAKEASDSDSGSETETDSDSETEPPSNPPPSETAVAAAKPKKKEETLAPSCVLAVPAAKKRPSEGASREADSKRAKQGDDEKKIGGEDPKKPAFHRLWREEDEITVLQGMIDFKNETGKSPYEDTNGYYDFIKRSISFEVSKNQFMDKIRSLRKKYMGKEKKPSLTKPHDQESYKLCKYIWGPEGMALESAVKSNGKSQKSKKKKLDSVKQELSFSAVSPNGKMVEEEEKALPTKPDWFGNSFLVPSIAGFGVDEYYVKQRWSLVSAESKKKIEEKLKNLRGKEIDFVLQKTELLVEVTSMIAEASKNKPLDM